MKSHTIAFVAGLLLILPLGGVAQALDQAAALQEVAFDIERWHIEADESRIEEHLGRTSLYLKNGRAWLEDTAFTDGVLEFDLAFTGERGFMGAMWRLEGAGNYEGFYVRPHQSGKPDANQYTPAFFGLTSWQLYHGPGYGAPVEYRYDAWNRVRVVVSGDQAEIYVNDMERPALFVQDQKRETAAGTIGVNAFFAPAHFSRFRFRAGSPPAFRSSAPPAPESPAGAVRGWEVSDSFAWAELGEAADLPKQVASERSWSKLASEPSGLANLGQVNARADGNTAFARITLHADEPRTVRVRFGYSDRVRVYFDGRAIYAGDNGYRTRDYRHLGTIGFFDEVFLPLRAGDNSLWFAVAESFGGWGVQAIVVETEGATVAP